MTASVTVAILAGGQGRRLGGVDKGLQLLDGKPLIAHACKSIVAMQAPQDMCGERKVLILANRNSEEYSTFASTVADDTDCGEGPLAGIATALSASTTPWLLTVPVDCPHPPIDLWRKLHGAITDTDCAVAYDGVRRQPLFALYRCGLATSAGEAARAGLGPQAWQDQIACVEVDFEDGSDGFANLNTVFDFHAWQASEND